MSHLTNLSHTPTSIIDDDDDISSVFNKIVIINDTNKSDKTIEVPSSVADLPRSFVHVPHHPLEQVIGIVEEGVKIRARAERFAHCAFVSQAGVEERKRSMY